MKSNTTKANIATKQILQDVAEGIKRNTRKKEEELRNILHTEYDHDCKAGPESGCRVCAWIDNATLPELIAKRKELDNDLQLGRDEHIEGDEHEHPTPSDTKNAIDNFGVNLDNKSKTSKIL